MCDVSLAYQKRIVCFLSCQADESRLFIILGGGRWSGGIVERGRVSEAEGSSFKFIFDNFTLCSGQVHFTPLSHRLLFYK